MNIKTPFSKVTAIAVSLATICGSLTATAKPPEILMKEVPDLQTAYENFQSVSTDRALVDKYYEEEEKRFLESGEGAFRLDASATCDSNVDKLILAIFLNAINDFFDRYAHIKSALIKISGIFGDYKFTINCKPIDRVGEPLAVSNSSPGQFGFTLNQGVFNTDNLPHLFETMWNGMAYGVFAGPGDHGSKEIVKQPKGISAYSLIAYVMHHELGHTAANIDSAISLCESPDQKEFFRNYRDVIIGRILVARIDAAEKGDLEISPEEFARISKAYSDLEDGFMGRFPSEGPDVQGILNTYPTFRQRQMERIKNAIPCKKDLFGYPIYSFLSTTSEKSPSEYIAEIVAHAMVTGDKPTINSKSALTWLDALNKKCEQFVKS